jgi:hypothetical protein
VLTYPTPAPGIVVEELDDEICLYRSDIDEVLVLNQTAADVWRLADGTLDVDELISCLAQAYSVGPAEIHPEVVAVVANLVDRGYLAPGPSPIGDPTPSADST